MYVHVSLISHRFIHLHFYQLTVTYLIWFLIFCFCYFNSYYSYCAHIINKTNRYTYDIYSIFVNITKFYSRGFVTISNFVFKRMRCIINIIVFQWIVQKQCPQAITNFSLLVFPLTYYIFFTVFYILKLMLHRFCNKKFCVIQSLRFLYHYFFSHFIFFSRSFLYRT